MLTVIDGGELMRERMAGILDHCLYTLRYLSEHGERYENRVYGVLFCRGLQGRSAEKVMNVLFETHAITRTSPQKVIITDKGREFIEALR
jgi:predicted transcriptional regulator